MSSKNFKAIIVGGGPVGLTAAHALSRAGIDFVLLESRPGIVIDAGSNLVLLPMGLRILSQLGLLDTFNTVSSPLGRIQRFDHNGRDLGDANFFIRYKENHGIAPRVVARHDLTRVLYDSLPASVQSNLLPNKRVSSISSTPSSVTVTCKDGTSYTGSILIGADGAHSFVRSQMRTLALESNAPESAINPAQPFLTTYRAMWIRLPTQADLTPGDAKETHGRDCAIQTFVGEETSVIGLYERLPEPTTERLRFGVSDEEDFVDRWGHLPLSKEMTVKAAWETKVQAGLVSLEEGVVPNWSWNGQIVLVGDAAHMFTPSTGAGCNNGMVDVVALVNEVVKALGEGGQEAMGGAFEEYQRMRYEAVVRGCDGAARATATATWKDGVFKFVDLHVMKRKAVQKMLMDRGAVGIASTPVLDFVEDTDLPDGRVPWLHQGGQMKAAMAA